MDSVSPDPPRITSWWATSPGRRTEWIGTSPCIAAAVALAVPDGASSFVAWCSSTISAACRCRDASAANRIISTAPIAKFGATKTGNSAARATWSTSAVSHPLVPTTQGTPAVSARRTFGTTAPGAVKSTIASASASVSTSSCPASTSAGPSTAPTLPISGEGGLWPYSRIFIRSSAASGKRASGAPHAARANVPHRVGNAHGQSPHVLKPAPTSGASRCARERRRHLLECLEEALLARADPGRGQPLRREQGRRQLRDELGLDRLDLGDDAVEGEDLGVGHERLSEPVHSRRRRLHAEHDAPLEVLLR